MSRGTSCSLALFSHSGLLGDVRNAASLGGYTFPVQKASEHSQTSGKSTHPSHPFLQGFTLQIFLTLLPKSK